MNGKNWPINRRTSGRCAEVDWRNESKSVNCFSIKLVIVSLCNCV